MRGGELYPTLFDDALYKMADVIDYDVTLERMEQKVRLSLVVEVLDLKETLREEMTRELLGISVVRKEVEAGRMSIPVVEMVSPGHLGRSGRAKKLILEKEKVLAEERASGHAG